MRIEVWGVEGVPEIRDGDDVGLIVADALRAQGTPLLDGDVVIVTSKAVSKAEGRVRRDITREEAVALESAEVIASWPTASGGTATVARTRHGFVMAAAGVDASNTEPGTVVLLPVDPDASARRLRARLREVSGADVGVVVTDTFGRPWRDGLVDLAVGAAGVTVLDDLRGTTDPYGNELGVTIVAVADEIAAASELVRHKMARVPAAVLRGLSHAGGADGPGAAAVVRDLAADRFSLGTREAADRAVRESAGVDLSDVDAARARTGAAIVGTALPGAVVEIRLHADAARAALVVSGDPATVAAAEALLRVVLAAR